MTSLGFLDFGFSELILVGVVALLVFGGNLPDVMRTLGRNYAKLRQTLREFSAPVREEFDRVRDLPTPEGIVSRTMADVTATPTTDEELEDAVASVDDGDEEEGPMIDEPSVSAASPRRKDPEPLDEGPPV